MTSMVVVDMMVPPVRFARLRSRRWSRSDGRAFRLPSVALEAPTGPGSACRCWMSLNSWMGFPATQLTGMVDLPGRLPLGSGGSILLIYATARGSEEPSPVRMIPVSFLRRMVPSAAPPATADSAVRKGGAEMGPEGADEWFRDPLSRATLASSLSSRERMSGFPTGRVGIPNAAARHDWCNRWSHEGSGRVETRPSGTA